MTMTTQKKNKAQCLKLLVDATSQFLFDPEDGGFIAELYSGNPCCHDVLCQAGFPWNRRLRFSRQIYILDPGRVEYTGLEDILICATHWTDEELNTAFARKWIWPAEDLDDELKQRIDKLKAKKAETERAAIESCTILPVDVVKHVLCSYF